MDGAGWTLSDHTPRESCSAVAEGSSREMRIDCFWEEFVRKVQVEIGGRCSLGFVEDWVDFVGDSLIVESLGDEVFELELLIFGEIGLDSIIKFT